ncbi:hypothetical protein EV356DRAFT_509449 [Viridothelium virens]|uniref:VWFA domain-containing protein n=1 Tax=Viridothelium virens TaxID=1048519 RepID=A0A6A6GWR6_VIRVR|nr:hypothetical protein EV356DRAFT_509449 [Viridothelium virens]
MSVTILSPSSSFHSHTPFHVARRSSTMERRKGILGSLKGKFSRKEGPSTSSVNSFRSEGFQRSQEMNTHPERPSAPPTRRPDRHSAFVTPSTTEAPPSYAAATTSSPAAPAPAGDDDPYSFLTSFDTTLVVDDSGSMAGSRWNETSRALETITPICTSHDADGIDIFFLNHPDNAYYHNVTSSATVREIFSQVRPGGSTPTGQRLNTILRNYLRKYENNPNTTKPLNIIVITDGEPSDDVESPIISAAKKLDKLDAPAWQVGIQFFQVGRDAEATKHLKQLDDDLAEISGDEDLRDVVDTTCYKGESGGELTGEGVLKVVLGSVNRRLDRKKSKDLHR